MNVAFDPWIPVVTLDGKPKLASLCEVLTEGHLLADLAVRPHERVALMRLFLCVAHAALDGPKDYDEWCEVPKRLPDAAKKYLETWKDSFELFHPTKPWLQVAGLKSDRDGAEIWTPLSKLSFFLATGENTTLFDHEGMNGSNRNLSIESTIVSMVAFQAFSVGGLMGRTYWGGELCGTPADPKKANGPVKSEDGPCVSSSMLHGLIRRENILHSVAANLPSYEDVHFHSGDSKPIGRPVWEKFPTSINDEAARTNASKSYLGRLMPLTRYVRIDPDGRGMILGNGIEYVPFKRSLEKGKPPIETGEPPELTATVVVSRSGKKENRSLLSYQPGKSFWRELASIVVCRNAEGTGGPLSLRSLGEGAACDLVISALARDQATIADATESVYHIPARLRSQEGLGAYQGGVQEAEQISWHLGDAIEKFRSTLDGGWEGRVKSAGPSKNDLLGKLHGTGAMSYWTRVETQLGLLLAHIEALDSDRAESTRKDWREMLWQSARDAYASVCGQETPRQIKAFTEGWKELDSRPKVQDKTPKRKGAKK